MKKLNEWLEKVPIGPQTLCNILMLIMINGFIFGYDQFWKVVIAGWLGVLGVYLIEVIFDFLGYDGRKGNQQ